MDKGMTARHLVYYDSDRSLVLTISIDPEMANKLLEMIAPVIRLRDANPLVFKEIQSVELERESTIIVDIAELSPDFLEDGSLESFVFVDLSETVENLYANSPENLTDWGWGNVILQGDFIHWQVYDPNRWSEDSYLTAPLSIPQLEAIAKNQPFPVQ